MENLLSVDLEEWYHFRGADIPSLKRTRGSGEPFVVRATLRLLELLDEYRCSATFFVLGEIAREFPALVREVFRRGHEIGSHGDEHIPYDSLGREETRRQVSRSLESISGLSANPVIGFRAPFLSGGGNSHLFDALAENKIVYDSSVKQAPLGQGGRGWYEAGSPDGRIIEFSPGIFTAGNRSLVLGGAYLRLLPSFVVAGIVSDLNARGLPAQVFLHPRDIAETVPRTPMTPWRRFMYAGRLGKGEAKLRALLSTFTFIPYSRYMQKYCMKS